MIEADFVSEKYKIKINKAVNLGCSHKYRHEQNERAVGFKMDGLDIENHGQKYIHDLDVLPFPFKDNELDFVFSNSNVEHLRLNLVDFFKELHRVIRPNGKAHIILPNAFFWKSRVRFMLGNYTDDGNWHPYHTRLIKPSQLKWYCQQIGFAAELQSCYSNSVMGFLEKRFPDFFMWKIDLIIRKKS